MGIIATLIIGAIAGWLGGTIYKGSGLGLIGNIIIGILGSGVGYWLLGNVFHISLGEGWIGAILTGAIGAIVILFLINLVFKKKFTEMATEDLKRKIRERLTAANFGFF